MESPLPQFVGSPMARSPSAEFTTTVCGVSYGQEPQCRVYYHSLWGLLYGQEPRVESLLPRFVGSYMAGAPSGESTTTVCGVNNINQLLAVMLLK